MDFSFRFDWWYARLPESPRDAGRVKRLVLRPREGERSSPDSIELSPERGIEGDRWFTDEHRRPGNQVSLINAHVIDDLCTHDPARAIQCGDNLHVDLDLGEANLPAGTTLTAGECVLEVTPDVHRPCRKFHERFGVTAVKKIVRANKVGRRGRGVMTRVVCPGTIRVGDTIYVKRPGRACLS